MKTEIPNAKYIQAILDGKEVECEIRNYVASPDHWRVVDIVTIVKCPTLTYRIKPTTIKIGGIEVPEPLRTMPPKGTDVYWPSFGPATGGLYCESCEVGYYPRALHHLLESGMLHASAEACHQHSLALISISKGE